MPRGKPLKNPNGYGSVVKLSGKRRNPFEVRVNTRMDERYYPVYDVLDRYPSREDALIALAEYHKNPYSISDREITFTGLYEKFYKNKYEYSGKTFSKSSIYCTKSAYQHCSALYDRIYATLRPDDFRSVLGQMNEKGYSSYASITVSEDDTPGVPFTAEELQILWDNKNIPWVDSILIYIYSGWRVSELILMPPENIDLAQMTFKGGLKTAAGKNRIVPIHSKIQEFVTHRLTVNHGILFALNGQPITSAAYTRLFKRTLPEIGIDIYHTPHDCRHTFTSLLDSAGVNQVCIDRLIGHASKSLTTRIYTHKSIEELRKAVEMI